MVSVVETAVLWSAVGLLTGGLLGWATTAVARRPFWPIVAALLALNTAKLAWLLGLGERFGPRPTAAALTAAVAFAVVVGARLGVRWRRRLAPPLSAQ